MREANQNRSGGNSAKDDTFYTRDPSLSCRLSFTVVVYRFLYAKPKNHALAGNPSAITEQLSLMTTEGCGKEGLAGWLRQEDFMVT